MLKHYLFFFTLVISIIITSQNLHAQTQWQGEFGLGLSDEAYAMTEAPNGDIYVAGAFDHAGSYATSGLARWDGEYWHPVADFEGDVRTLLVHENILYAAGDYSSLNPQNGSEINTPNIAMKDLSSGQWSGMGDGLDGGSVRTLTANEAGSIYAGGCFIQSGDRSVDRVAVWNGDSWNPLKAGTEDQNGVSSCVYDLIYDDDLDRLYLGGSFRSAVNWNSNDKINETITLGGIAYYDGRWRQVGGGISDDFPGLPNPRVNTIHLHENGDLYVGGTLWTAYNDSDRNDETDVRTLARWDGSQWHSVFDESRGQTHIIVADGDLLHLGGSFETAAAEGQDAFTANSYAQYSVETGQLLTNTEGESATGEGFTDGVASDATQRSSGLIRSILIQDDEVFVAGRFDRAEIEDDFTDNRRMKHISRWDGNTWHALGTGVSDAVTDLSALGDTLFIAGEFHHVANRGEMFPSPHLTVFDRETGLFISSENSVRLLSWHDGRGYRVATDPATGTAYAAVGAWGLTDADGETERGNIVEWNSTNERWDMLGRLTNDGPDVVMSDMLITNRSLYISGQFDDVAGIENLSPGGSLVRYNLDSGGFDFPDLADQIATRHHYGQALTLGEDCLYTAFRIENFHSSSPGNVMCLDLETDQTQWYPGVHSFPRGIMDLHKDGEYLYIAGNRSGNVNFYNDEGELRSTLELSPHVSVLHPKTERLISWPGDFSSFARGITTFGNSVYIAGDIRQINGIQTEDYDGIARFDMGADQWHSIGDTKGRLTFRDGIAEIDGELWTWGDFRYTGNSGSAYLARFPELTEGTSGPVAGRYKDDLTLALHQDQIVDLPIYVPNLGNEPLDWSVAINSGTELQQGATTGNETQDWISAGSSSGTVPAGSMDSLIVTLDPSAIESGVFETSIEITNSDAASTVNKIPISLTVNPLHAATGAQPADGANNVSFAPDLSWENQRFPDEVTVYLGTSENFTEDDILYNGEVINSITADSLVSWADGPLNAFETYYWRVDQSNSAAEAEGEVWSFTTSPGENKIVIGDQEWGVDYFPVYPSSNPSWIQKIFPASDIGRSGTITSLAYHYLGEAYAELEIEIYMGTTKQGVFDDSDSWIPASDLTLVYDGVMEMKSSAGEYWLNLELDQGFTYDGSENLVIGVFSSDNLEPESALNSFRFYATSRDENLSMFWYGEENVTPEDAPGNGYSWSELPDIRLTFGDDDEVIDPEAPMLTTPQDGAENLEPEQIVLGWVQPEEADSLQLQISNDPGFDSESTFSAYVSSDSDSYKFTDLLEQNTYHWRLRAYKQGVAGDWSDAWSFTTTLITSITDSGELPNSVKLRQNYPNPFNPDTQIRYGIPESSHVQITVYNTLGQRVTTLVNETQTAGWHNVRFDASGLSSGMYLYQISADGVNQTRTMMLVK